MHKQTHYEGNLKTRLENEDLFGNDFIASFMLLITLFNMLQIADGYSIFTYSFKMTTCVKPIYLIFPDYLLSNNNYNICT